MAEFLLELFSEEIPARMQVKAANDLKDMITVAMTEKGLPFTKAEAYSTPRRITLVVEGMPECQPDIAVEKRGPRTDAPQQALDGFLKANNLANFDKCTKEETPKGAFWFYREMQKGQPSDRVMAEVSEQAIAKFVWPKSMRWKSGAKSWVRPLHSIVALFNGQTVSVQFDLGGGEKQVRAGAQTYGHRFLSSGALTVTNFADYKTQLEKAHVILCREDRKKTILEGARKLAESVGLMVNEDEGLLEEIVGLVEYPVPLIGSFEKEYLEVPQEVLISTMRTNQRYIPLLTKDGKLTNKFIVIANTTTKDGGALIVKGNEKVLRARLSDAKFFYDQDKRYKLESRNATLQNITFHKKLGTVFDKVNRMQRLSQFIARAIGADEGMAGRAAALSKADLSSSVVFEFPEVQGIMGRYYALLDGEPADVAHAIADHYKPIGANDSCPTAPVSICVALADKLDTLVGFFAIDEKPTGSKDPFALRRAALGIIRIILENKLEVPLMALVEAAYQNFSVKGLKPLKEISDELMLFFMDRLKVALKDKGIRHDLIDAVFATPVKNDNLTEVTALVTALSGFVATENGANLLTAYRRGANILKIEEKKDKAIYSGEKLVQDLLNEAPEAALAKVLAESSQKLTVLFGKKDFTGCMAVMADLRVPVDAFFDKTIVNAPDEKIRVNRLCLLARLRDTMNTIADFSKMEG